MFCYRCKEQRTTLTITALFGDKRSVTTQCALCHAILLRSWEDLPAEEGTRKEAHNGRQD